MSTLAQGHANLLCIVPKTLTETRQSTEKKRQQIYSRATCSADVHRCRPDSNNTKDTRVFAGSRRTTYRDQKKTCVLVKNCHPRVTFDAPKPDAGNSVQQRLRKHGQREILERRNIRQVPNKRRVEVQSQNRDLLICDVCTFLACPKTFPRSLTTLKRHVDVIRISYA